MAGFECLIEGIAAARSSGELFDALDNASIITGNIQKTCYGCGRCALPVTVEYPKLTEPYETTGIALGRGAAMNCLSATSAKDIKAIKDRFEQTTPLVH